MDGGELTAERYIEDQLLRFKKFVNGTSLRRVICNRLAECRDIEAARITRQ